MKNPSIFILVLFGVHLFSILSWGSCKNLPIELQAMRNAQKTVVESLADNHEAFARLLEQNAKELDQNFGASSEQVVPKIRAAGAAIRQRGLVAHSQNRNLDRATVALIKKIEYCLRVSR